MVPASGGGRVPPGWAPPPVGVPAAWPPRTWRTAECVAAAAAGAAAAGAPRGLGRALGGSPSGWAEGGVCVWGARWGLAAGEGRGGSASPPAAWSPHPSPVVLCCFRGGGRAVAPRGLGPAAPTRRSAAPSPPSFGRPAGGATGAMAGAVGYEWSGAGPRRPPVTAAGGGRALGGRPPSGGGKLTPRGARRRGTPVSGSEGERGLWPLLEASGPPLRPPRRPGLGPVAFTHPPSHLPEPED